MGAWVDVRLGCLGLDIEWKTSPTVVFFSHAGEVLFWTVDSLSNLSNNSIPYPSHTHNLNQTIHHPHPPHPILSLLSPDPLLLFPTQQLLRNRLYQTLHSQTSQPPNAEESHRRLNTLLLFHYNSTLFNLQPEPPCPNRALCQRKAEDTTLSTFTCLALPSPSNTPATHHAPHITHPPLPSPSQHTNQPSRTPSAPSPIYSARVCMTDRTRTRTCYCPRFSPRYLGYIHLHHLCQPIYSFPCTCIRP